eukprot:6479525-Amphidinium_carterae.1
MRSSESHQWRLDRRYCKIPHFSAMQTCPARMLCLCFCLSFRSCLIAAAQSTSKDPPQHQRCEPWAQTLHVFCFWPSVSPMARSLLDELMLVQLPIQQRNARSPQNRLTTLTPAPASAQSAM